MDAEQLRSTLSRTRITFQMMLNSSIYSRVVAQWLQSGVESFPRACAGCPSRLPVQLGRAIVLTLRRTYMYCASQPGLCRVKPWDARRETSSGCTCRYCSRHSLRGGLCMCSWRVVAWLISGTPTARDTEVPPVDPVWLSGNLDKHWDDRNNQQRSRFVVLLELWHGRGLHY